MAIHGFTNRRELEEHTFHPALVLLAILLALFLGSYLPKLIPALEILDLPLIVVIFFSVSRRSPIAGTFTGAIVGILQDLLTNHYLGIFGIAKSVVGYAAASIGLRIDVENIMTRVLLNFSFCILQSILLYLVGRLLLGVYGYSLQWLHELLRATVNTIVAIPIFFLLDYTRTRD